MNKSIEPDIWVIGDVHGCFKSLNKLVNQIPGEKVLWQVGDLVNRGPASLETLRWARDQGKNFKMVLGNHDLHLLGVSQGLRQQNKKSPKSDTLDDILQAPDCESLINWLRHQPIAHFSHGWLMTHAGILPEWSLETALNLAAEVESALRSDEWVIYLQGMYGNSPTQWNHELKGADRLRFITNAFTRLRRCTHTGEMHLKKMALETTSIEPPTVPWFSIFPRACKNPVVFGHWSEIGLTRGENYLCIDTGCIWGKQLSAVRLLDQTVIQVHNIDYDPLSK